MSLLQRLRRAIGDDLADLSVVDLDQEARGLAPLWLYIPGIIVAALGFVAGVIAFVARL